MSQNDVKVFLPCRAGSERVPHKNTRPFAEWQHGLLELKLTALEKATGISQIILDSNDEKVLEYGRSRKSNWSGTAELYVQERPNHLGLSSTTTDALIQYALDNLQEGHLLWTHVTSPFLGHEEYERIIQAFFQQKDQGYDSLMTVNRLQTFLWDEQQPMNYDRDQLKWPRTQDVKPVFEVNSGAFLVPVDIAKTRQDRIGHKPYLFELNHIEAFDVDWPDDFTMAELLWQSKSQQRSHG
tara:strand:+ start:1044 stop:1763 length:720 start_codon:yes stop_codon:yes gene_type:complete